MNNWHGAIALRNRIVIADICCLSCTAWISDSRLGGYSSGFKQALCHWEVQYAGWFFNRSFEAWFGDMSRCTIYNIHHLDTSLLELPYLLSFTSGIARIYKKNCFQMSQWLLNEIFVMHCYRLLFTDSLYLNERIKMVSSIEGIFCHLHANLLPFK